MQELKPTWRKPFGMFAILLLIALWCVAVVTVVEQLALPQWAAAIVFIGGGIIWLWLFPMKRLLRWMEIGKWRE